MRPENFGSQNLKNVTEAPQVYLAEMVEQQQKLCAEDPLD